MADIQWVGMKELKAAVKRSPERVKKEINTFLVKGIAEYHRGIVNVPWRVGGFGGGSPVSNDPRYPRKYQKQRSGNLRDSHKTLISNMTGIIGPSMSIAPYAKYVHDGTRRMVGRPWLDYVQDSKKSAIEALRDKMLHNIVDDLAK